MSISLTGRYKLRLKKSGNEIYKRSKGGQEMDLISTNGVSCPNSCEIKGRTRTSDVS